MITVKQRYLLVWADDLHVEYSDSEEHISFMIKDKWDLLLIDLLDMKSYNPVTEEWEEITESSVPFTG